MNQITAFSRKMRIIFTLLALLTLFHPTAETSPPPAVNAPTDNKIEKDEILEELKLSAQGIFTDSDTEESIAENNSTGSNTDQSEPSTDSNTEETSPMEEESSKKEDIRQMDKSETNEKKISEDETPPSEPEIFVEDKDLPAIKTQRIEEYEAHPSRIKKEELEQKLNAIINQNPKNEEAYWELFELQNHYTEWSQNTEFYQENQLLHTLKLLQDIHKQFGENQKIMKYLCQYFIINHLYVESQPYCQKAKKLLPNDTDLHIYADYLSDTSNQKSENRPLNKSQVLLNILKTKPHSEKLYTTIGQMFADKKKYKLATKYFQKAIKMNSSYIPALLGLGEALIKLNQHETALKHYILACQKHPYKSRVPFQQAKAYLSQKSLFKLASEYQKQINICVNSIKTSH
ncbi:MAG: hypothetical protein OXK80_01130 [Bdellovibrionales bacterium]|nr:hypothetical protein [Bdellovibrionales bacterium]